MEKIQFKTVIDAPQEKVWELLWDHENYSKWTSAFAEGSRAETDWKKGSKVLFLDGKGQGMVSVVADNIPNQFMSFKHLGMVRDGVEIVDTAETRDWAGSMENYTLKELDGKTELTVDLDISPEWKDYFVKTWPKALDNLKALAN